MEIFHPTDRPNFSQLAIGRLYVFFSYETPIAFRHRQSDGIVECARENDWGPTTGKHLSRAGCTSHRIPGEEFLDKLSKALAVEAGTETLKQLFDACPSSQLNWLNELVTRAGLADVVASGLSPEPAAL